MPIVLHALRHDLPVLLLDVARDAQLSVEVSIDAVVGLLSVHHDGGPIFPVDEVNEVLTVPRPLRALGAALLDDVCRDVRLSILLDELPELLSVPTLQLLVDVVHLQHVAPLELELDPEDDAKQAEGATPVAHLLLRVNHADATVVQHDPHPSGVAVNKACVVRAAVHAVRHDPAQLEEVAGRLRGQEVAERPHLLVQMRLSPAGVDSRPFAAVRHVVHAKLPFARRCVLGKGEYQDLVVLPVSDDAACRVSSATDADLVALGLCEGEQIPKRLIVLRHHPRRASVHVVGPSPERAPGFRPERRVGG
mmetsp:Transcript_109617/g.274593  ORF Transcript_109617/g.274593 Transcript_109617/m.274593 type:complete len:307 (+) Transcript_109617:739-1659(+)